MNSVKGQVRWAVGQVCWADDGERNDFAAAWAGMRKWLLEHTNYSEHIKANSSRFEGLNSPEMVCQFIADEVAAKVRLNGAVTAEKFSMAILLEAIKEQSMYLDCNRHLASEQIIDGMLTGMRWVRNCIEKDKVVELVKANPVENAPVSVAPAWLLEKTHVVEYSPNCKRQFMVRLCGYGKPHIDRLPVHESKNAIGFGSTLRDAAEQALKVYSDQRIAQREPAKPESPSIDPGPGYRLLEPGEMPQDGDEISHPLHIKWVPSVNWSSGLGQADRMIYRRKVAVAPADDLRRLQDHTGPLDKFANHHPACRCESVAIGDPLATVASYGKPPIEAASKWNDSAKPGDGWTAWNGGEWKGDPEARVKVRYDDGHVLCANGHAPAKSIDWSYVAQYRLFAPPEDAELNRFTWCVDARLSMNSDDAKACSQQ